MTATTPIYKPDWLEGDETFDLFKAAGFDRPAAAQWLAAAHHDYGLVRAEDADPDHDLFRLPRGASLDAGISQLGAMRSNLGKIDWPQLTVIGRYEDRSDRAGMGVSIFGPVSIEVSRAMLVVLFPKLAEPTTSYRRYPRDAALVNEGVKAIKGGKYANAHQAAQRLADRAEGPATLTSRIDRLEKAIREILKAGP